MASYRPVRQTPNSTLPHEFVVFGEGASCVCRPQTDRVASRPHRRLTKILKKDGWAEYPFSFHDSEELGPAILVKISKKTGLEPKDL